MEIRSLVGIDPEDIYAAFSHAFADYELQLDRAGFYAMMKRRGFDPALSFAAFDKGGIVAFTLNGTGNFNGIATAYDTGTGTLKEYRGRGLATLIFEYSIPFLKEKGIGQYLLEVLKHNTSAVSVYSKLGFGITREFNYFRAAMDDVRIKQTKNNYEVGSLRAEDFALPGDFLDFVPSWQNSFDSIKRSDDKFIYLAAVDGSNFVGYCIFEPESGDVTQIAVERGHRRKGIASLLLEKALKYNLSNGVKVINTEVSCDSITAFLAAAGIHPAGKQYEMILKL